MKEIEGLPGVLYSRKSRKDIEAEKEAALYGKPFDTLEKHRIELFKMSKRYKGHVVELLEEIVSGEFIAERPKMQRVLELLAEGTIKWVGVMDEDRLGRGDKIDQGRIERAFKESGAFIVTPYKIVDMRDEADELYMDYKGMGARYEYKQAKKRLHDGRRRSAGRGNYVGSKPPYGYLRGIDIKTNYPQLVLNYVDKASDMQNLRLYPHPVEAEYVKLIYSWSISGLSHATILDKLNKLTPSPTGKTEWRYKSLHRILKNPVYTGVIRFGKRKFTKLETGKYRQEERPNDEVQYSDVVHEPLVSEEEFKKVQEIIKENYNPPVNQNRKIINPMATLLKCHYCGLALSYRVDYSNKNSNRKPFIICRNQTCKKNHTVLYEHVEEELLRQVEAYYHLLKSDQSYNQASQTENNQINIFMKQRKEITKKIESFQLQLDNLHDLLEQKIYDVETFIQRQKKLLDQIKEQNEHVQEIDELISKSAKAIQEREIIIPKVCNVVERYRSASVEEKNKLLKSIIISIHYSKPTKYGSRSKPEFNLEVKWRDL